jgi:hypothetical protein
MCQFIQIIINITKVAEVKLAINALISSTTKPTWERSGVEELSRWIKDKQSRGENRFDKALVVIRCLTRT